MKDEKPGTPEQKNARAGLIFAGVIFGVPLLGILAFIAAAIGRGIGS